MHVHVRDGDVNCTVQGQLSNIAPAAVGRWTCDYGLAMPGGGRTMRRRRNRPIRMAEEPRCQVVTYNIDSASLFMKKRVERGLKGRDSSPPTNQHPPIPRSRHAAEILEA